MWLIIIVIAFSSITAEYSDPNVFIAKPEDQLAYEGNSTTMNCIANANLSLNKCRWMWKPDQDSGEEIQVEEFQAFGNLSNDCTTLISNVTSHHHGIWICVLLLNNKTIYKSPPAMLSVENTKNTENIKFIQSPQNITLEEGDALPLTCLTEYTIVNCYWLIKLSNEEDMIPVATFKPMNNNNCSMVLPNADKKHTGQWVCGVKRTEHDLRMVYSKHAFIDVKEKNEESKEENGTQLELSTDHELSSIEVNISFIEKPVDAVFVVGSNGSIQCISHKPLQQCRWFWQPQGYSDEWQVLMKEFAPEDEHDCSLHFKDVTTEPEGLWLCAVLPVNSSIYYQTKPVTLRIKTLIEFSVLTRAVVVAEGMETSLRCQTEADVEECRWRWHQLGEANAPSTVVTKFPPFGPSKQDCSIQFTNMLMEQQGVWVCGVKLTNEDNFKEAMPTTVSLKPAGRVRIIDISQPVTIAEKEYLLITCIASASVNECSWEWTPTNTKFSAEVIHFMPNTRDSRNCSLRIDSVENKHDGLWRCSVEAKRDKGAVRASTDPIRVTVIKPVAVTFKTVAKVIHASPGSNHQLDCQVLGEVSMCRWKFLGKPDVIKAEFPPVNGTDCSLNLEDLKILNSGYWQCGVKSIGQYHYVYAPLTTLNVLHTENITTSYTISETTNQLSLACHLDTNLPMSIMSCRWVNPTRPNSTSVKNYPTRHKEYFDENNGDCILEFQSHESNPGIWQCLYSVDTENGTWKLGEAKFVVVSNPQNLRLRLIVAILAAIAVIMAIVLAIAIVYGCPWTATPANDELGKSKGRVGQSTSRLPSKQSVRYTEEPGRINFHFQETPKLLVDLSLSSSTPPNHVYERVGQYVSPVVPKTIYQNIK